MKKNIIINCPNGNITLDELLADVEASKRFFKSHEYCFTRETVQALIDKINQLSENKVLEVLPNNDMIQSFKDKHKNFNQSDLDWLIEILNPEQYEKVERKCNKTDILYKKDNKTCMLQDTKTDVWYLDYNLIWVVFKSKFGDNCQLFSDLTKGILVEVYNCKVDTTYRYYNLSLSY